MMKPVRHHIKLSRWEQGEAFTVPVPFAWTVKRAARAVTFREQGPRPLFQPQMTPLKPFERQGPWPNPRAWYFRAFLALLLLAAPAVRAQVTNAVAGSRTNLSNRLDYSSFKLIADRNIFNSTRSGKSARSGGESAKPAKVDSFTLVGTMAYEKGRFAFFDGSGSEFRKVVKPDGAIAGYKILDITPAHVTLGRDGKEVELRVGTQMRRQDEGEWQQTSQAAPAAGSGRPAAATKADASAGSDSGGEESEVLKRLLQKREAEENK